MIERMDVYSKRGTKVKVIEETVNSGRCYDRDKVRKMITIDKVYHVDYTIVEFSYSRVYLLEIPEISFNTVNFVNV